MPISQSDLELYFKVIFPTKAFYDWLSYGDPEVFRLREFSFTLPGDIYVRFRSYEDFQELATDLVRKKPEKIDIGGVYNVPPKQRDAHAVFHPTQKELVFDIDISDYDDVRVCCQDKDICNHCWPLMSTAVKILRHLLTEDFGFAHLMFVFSGRRGVHCWCCDRKARMLTDEERSAVAAYMNLHEGGGGAGASGAEGGGAAKHKLNVEFGLRKGNLHPSIEEVYTQFVKPGFVRMYLNEDNPNNIQSAKTKQNIGSVIAKYVKGWNADLNDKVNAVLNREKVSCMETWNRLVSLLTNDKAFRGCGWIPRLIEFVFMFPRLDINVSKSRGHLLKAPFVIHPGTGNVCLPIDPDYVDDFRPSKNPKLTEVLAAYERDNKLLASHLNAFERFVAGCQADAQTHAASAGMKDETDEF